jgi:hypothetical protein
LGSGGETGRGETGTGSIASWDRDTGGSGETGGRRLGAGGVLNIGRDGNKDLRCMNKGIRFSTGAETAGADGKQDEGDSAGRGKDAGEGQAAVNRASTVNLRGEGNMGEGLMDEGAASSSSGVSGSKADASEMSRRMGKYKGAPSKTDGAWGSCSEGGGGSSIESKGRGAEVGGELKTGSEHGASKGLRAVDRGGSCGNGSSNEAGDCDKKL